MMAAMLRSHEQLNIPKDYRITLTLKGTLLTLSRELLCYWTTLCQNKLIFLFESFCDTVSTSLGVSTFKYCAHSKRLHLRS